MREIALQDDAWEAKTLDQRWETLVSATIQWIYANLFYVSLFDVRHANEMIENHSGEMNVSIN